MKLLLKLLISGAAIILLMGLPHAFGNVICISETANKETAKWIVSIYSPNCEEINSESKTFQEISKDSFVANFSGDGNRIILSSGYRKGKKSIEIWSYDLEDNSSSKLMTLSASPSFNAFSIDGRYLVYQMFPVKEPALFIVDLLSKKIEKIDTSEIILLPVRFSPYNNHQIFCLGGKGSFDYGIYNINTGEFIKIKPIDNPENAMHLIMSSDWVDWR